MTSENPIASFTGPWGIPIQIMPSMGFLLLLFVGLSAGGMGSLVSGLAMFAIIVASILAHELGHAWGAKVQGVPVQRVVLHGGGGFCQHRSAGARASELIVIMGPLVNLALWAILSLASEVMWSTMPTDANLVPGGLAAYQMQLEIGYWLWLASDLNLMLFLLNMIPVQPLDGGKLLHLWLLRVLSQESAMQITGAVGLVCTVLWIPAMILLYVTFGFVLLFFPSLRAHWAMLRGGARLNRLRRH